MSRIDELLSTLAPRGVRYVEIDRLFDLRNGYTPAKSNASFWEDGTVPWFRMEDLRSNGGVLSRALQRISASAVKGDRLFPANSLLIATSATIGEHALILIPHLSNQRFTSLALRTAYADCLEMKFVYYYAFKLAEWCHANTTTSSFASVDMSGFRQFRFPVPPLEVQQEIVRVLDQFATLEAELEAELGAELEARRKQYDHYRGSLLTFAEGTPGTTLGELGVIFGGLTGKSKADFANGNARFASYRNVFTNVSLDVRARDFVRVSSGERQRALEYGDVIFTGSSESVEEVGMSSVVTTRLSEPMYLNSFCIGFRPHDLQRLHPEFSKHLFRSASMRSQIIRTANGVTRINVSKARLAEVQVPLPDPGEQERIAGILDQFEALTNDLSIGLPAELTARRKQYEYYRDKLLTFEEAPA